MSSHLINTRLEHYHLIEVLGQGGMAAVYKAHQWSNSLGRDKGREDRAKLTLDSPPTCPYSNAA